MAFLIDRGIATESEEEFDAEGDRYEELRSRLLGGQTMKYEEMEELLAAAKAKNDQKVVDALKNVVDDPETEAVFEEEIPDFPADEFKGCPNHPDGDKRPETQYKIKDKYGRWIIVDKAKKKKNALRKNKTGMNSIALAAADDELQKVIDRLVERKDLTADECEWDLIAFAAGELILTYRGIDWDEGHAASAFGPNKGGWFAEGIKDDVESDLARIRGAFLSSSEFDLEFAQDSVQTAIDDASEMVRKDGKDAISRKENELGEWEYTADCVVRIPCRLTYGPMRAMSEDDEFQEKEELLPDCVVNEAIETLRRMY